MHGAAGGEDASRVSTTTVALRVAATYAAANPCLPLQKSLPLAEQDAVRLCPGSSAAGCGDPSARATPVVSPPRLPPVTDSPSLQPEPKGSGLPPNTRGAAGPAAAH